MKKLVHKNFITLLTIIGLSSMQLAAQSITNPENFAGSLNGWGTNFGTSTVTYADAATSGTTDGALKMVRADNNANFGIKNVASGLGLNASNFKAIKIRFKNGTKASQFRVGGTNGNAVVLKDNAGADINFPTTADAGVNTAGYTTQYLDMTSYNLWTGNMQNFWIGVRNGYVAGEAGNFYLDKIEFLATMPEIDSYSEFIKNPSFDDISNIPPFNVNTQGTFASRALSSEAAHDGENSLKYTYTADADANFWAFSNYSKTYTTMQLAGTTIQVKMWIKTNRHLSQPAAEIPAAVSCRVKLENTLAVTDAQPIVTLTTTNLVGDWEELTFDLAAPADFNKATLWVNLGYDATAGVTTNLKAGNIVYLDQMTATLGTPLAVKQNTLEGVSIYPNPVSNVVNVNAPEGSVYEIYNSLGALVKTSKTTSAASAVSVSDLASGLYIIKVSNEGKTFQNKLIKK